MKNLPVSIRLIQEEDIEMIRIWKNKNKDSFFDKNIITIEQQKQWYRAYRERPNDWLYIVTCGSIPIGTIGCRQIDGDYWDLYNVINGVEDFKKRGIMAKALHLVLEFCHNTYRLPIRASVLRNNKALNWYLRNNFSIIDTQSDFFLLEYTK